MIAALVALAFAAAPVVEEPKEAKAAGDVVDLNNASAVELCTLPGIGPKKAEAIVAMRSKRAFTRVTQLLQVKGIGPKTLDRLKTHVRLGPTATAPTMPTMPAMPTMPTMPAATPPPPTTTTTPLVPLPPLAPLVRPGVPAA